MLVPQLLVQPTWKASTRALCNADVPSNCWRPCTTSKTVVSKSIRPTLAPQRMLAQVQHVGTSPSRPSEVGACRAEEGMVAAKQMLLFTPCDLFPWIKGRTLWLVGDSIQQARSQSLQLAD